jgi:hypothetical protein
MYNLYSITNVYFRYPVDVTIRLLHQSELNFPAVTVCNMSPIKKSALEAANTAASTASSSPATSTASTVRKRKKRESA